MKNERTIYHPSSVIHRPSPIVHFVAVVLFLCACPASFGTIHWKDGLNHNINYPINENVWVDYQAPYMYTTVDVLPGGSINDHYDLRGYNHSRINVRGGSIYWLLSFDSSQVDVSGGSMHSIWSYDSSQINISGGSIDWGLYSSGSSKVNISSGSIARVYSSYSSQVNISGGSLNYFKSSDFSQVDISGGSINHYLLNTGSSRINISGGSIDNYLFLSDQSKMQIFGYDFAVDGQPFGYGELTSILGGYPLDEPLRHLTGTLLSGEFIDNDFYIGHDARIVLVPEPATLLLLGLGGLLLRRRK